MKKGIWFWPFFGSILIWVTLSAVFLFSNNPNQFQRAGTIGIAGAILWAAYSRNLAEWAISKSSKAEASASDLYGRVTNLLCKAQTLFETGDFDTSDEKEKLRVEIFDAGSEAKDAVSSFQSEASSTRRTVESFLGNLPIWEISIVCLSTLQTGYGEYFVNVVFYIVKEVFR